MVPVEGGQPPGSLPCQVHKQNRETSWAASEWLVCSWMQKSFVNFSVDRTEICHDRLIFNMTLFAVDACRYPFVP